MSRPPYGSVSKADAAAFGYSTVADQIPGIPNNPPSVNQAISALGLDNPVGRVVTDNLRNEFGKEVRGEEKPQYTRSDRRQFVLTCQSWLEKGKYIYCKVNPEQASWDLGLRGSERKTLAGSTMHYWRNLASVQRSSFFSEPVLNITFQSGNIMPVYEQPAPRRNDSMITERDVRNFTDEDAKNYLLNREAKKLPPIPPNISQGLNNFYLFADLLNETKIVDDGDNNRSANVVYLMYTSQIYPSIVLAGMFKPEGFSFTDSAQDPHQVKWTSSFVAYDSTPRFDSADMLLATWNAVPKTVPKS